MQKHISKAAAKLVDAQDDATALQARRGAGEIHAAYTAEWRKDGWYIAKSVPMPAPPSNIREPEPPESVTSTSTPDVASSTPEAPEEPANDNPPSAEASSTSQATSF